MDKICVIGIAGGTASGKTTIVNKLKTSFDTVECARHRQVRLASLAADHLFRKSLICSAASGEAVFLSHGRNGRRACG